MKSGKIWEKYSKTVKIEQKIFNLHHIDASFIHSWHMCATFFFLEYSFKQSEYWNDQVTIMF